MYLNYVDYKQFRFQQAHFYYLFYISAYLFPDISKSNVSSFNVFNFLTLYMDGLPSGYISNNTLPGNDNDSINSFFMRKRSTVTDRAPTVTFIRNYKRFLFNQVLKIFKANNCYLAFAC